MSTPLSRPQVVLMIVVGMVVVGIASAGLQAGVVRFDGDEWELSGDGTVVAEIEGREALGIQTGRAIHRGVDFRDGTIEFDLRHTEYRSFIYVQFRMASDSEYEEIYFRPHKSQLPDAIQYTPVYRGASQWQLFHGEGATAPARFAPNDWTRVRIVVRGDQAAVFIGEVGEPQLVVPRLMRGRGGGPIALRAFEPRIGSEGRPPGLFTAAFSNLEITSTATSYDFAGAEPPPVAEGVVRDWQLSTSFDPGEGPVEAIPPEVAAGGWTAATVEPSGVVLLARDVLKPEGVRRASVLARTTWSVDEPGMKRFDFGYSDEVSVFLNGRLLFSGDDSYSFDEPRRDGLLSIDQGTLYLPLEKGQNELVLAVTDVFGGWGVTGRLVDE